MFKQSYNNQINDQENSKDTLEKINNIKQKLATYEVELIFIKSGRLTKTTITAEEANQLRTEQKLLNSNLKKF